MADVRKRDLPLRAYRLSSLRCTIATETPVWIILVYPPYTYAGEVANSFCVHHESLVFQYRLDVL